MDSNIVLDVDFDSEYTDLKYELRNTSKYADIINIKFQTGMPTSVYEVRKLPEIIKPDSSAYATIRIMTQPLLKMAESFVSVKPSQFTYDVRTIVVV